jgi:hypothetical protein
MTPNHALRRTRLLRYYCLFFMIGVAAAVGAEEIIRDALMDKTRHWKEPKVAIWYYIGSQEGRDFSSIMISTFPRFTLLPQARFHYRRHFLARRSGKIGL